jgi:Tol biopolymer transport system component
MHSRWTALAALVALGGMSVLLGSCTTTSTSATLIPTPVVTGMFPASITAGSQLFTLNISGNGFINKPLSQVFWNGSMRTATLNATNGQLVVSILATDVASPGFATVTVVNPEPGGPSTGTTFQIDAVQSGTPLISGATPFSPASATPGSGAFTLTVNGSNFLSTSVVAWNGSPRTTTYVSSTQLTASIDKEDIAVAGFASVSVYNPTPGGLFLFSPSVDFQFGTGGMAFPMVASVNASGGPADGASGAPAISADGRFVAFYSQAKNLVAQGAYGNIFVRDTCLGAKNCTPKTIAADLASDGSAPNGKPDNHVALSADGRFVLFGSLATNLISAEEGASLSDTRALNLFVRDLCTGSDALAGCTPRTEGVSVDVNAQLTSGSTIAPSISADGRFVAFSSTSANLVAGQTGSGYQVFVRDTCAGASAGKSCVPNTSQVALDSEYLANGSEVRTPEISARGRYVAFVLLGPANAPGEGPRQSQILLRDTCFGTSVPATCVPATTAISVGPDGAAGNAVSQSPFVSADGRFVVFQSRASNLAAGASSGKFSIFLRDTCLGATAPDGCAVSTSLVPTSTMHGAAGNSDVHAPWISASGRYISFLGSISQASSAQGSRRETALFVRDTCFGVMTSCTPRTVPVAVPGSASQQPALRVDQSRAVPIISSGHIAAFFSTSSVPSAPSSGYGDVFLTLTSF